MLVNGEESIGMVYNYNMTVLPRKARINYCAGHTTFHHFIRFSDHVYPGMCFYVVTLTNNAKNRAREIININSLRVTCSIVNSIFSYLLSQFLLALT